MGTHSIQECQNALARLRSYCAGLRQQLQLCLAGIEQEKQGIENGNARAWQIANELQNKLNEYERLKAEYERLLRQADSSDSDDSGSGQDADSVYRRMLVLRQECTSLRSELDEVRREIEEHKKRQREYEQYLQQLNQQRANLWRMIEMVQSEVEEKRRDYGMAQSTFSSAAGNRYGARAGAAAQAAAMGNTVAQLNNLSAGCVEVKNDLMDMGHTMNQDRSNEMGGRSR